MWQRIKRMFRSFVGFFVELGEDPELILRQNIRDMEDQIPDMNKNIAMIKANQTLLEKELTRLRREEGELSAKIQVALKASRRDMALNYAQRLEQVRKDKLASEQQHEMATQATEKAMQVKKAFMREKELKTKQAMAAIQAKKRSQWQSKVADAMENFQVAGMDASHDEMIRRLDEESAEKEARMELALGNVDQEAAQIEEEAKMLEANDLLHQFELQMGLVQEPAATTAAPEKTMGPSGRDEDRERQKA